MANNVQEYYAFTASQSWNPGPNIPANYWSIAKGDIGWVIGPPNGRWARIQILKQDMEPLRRGNATDGIVPEIAIQRGRPRSQFRDLIRRTAFSANVGPPANAPDLLGQALQALLQRTSQEAGVLRSKGLASTDAEKLKGSTAKYAKVIYQGVRADVRNVMKHGSISFEDFYNIPAIGPNDSRSGIYLYLYKNLQGAGPTEAKNAWYVGKTRNLAKRVWQHEKNINSNDPNVHGKQHYAIARRSQSHRVIPLAIFPTSIENYEFVLKFAEHCFVSLLLSWNPIVLRIPQTFADYQRTGRDVQAAVAFYDLSVDVFAKLGWPKTPRVRGCNFKTPGTEGDHYDPVPWYSIHTPDTLYRVLDESVNIPRTRMRTHFRQPTKVQPIGEDSIAIQMFTRSRIDDQDNNFWIQLPKDVGIEKGDVVQLVCEVMLDGSEHPKPWARLPRFGPFSDYQRLNSLGMKIIWKRPNGQVVQCPLQRSLFFGDFTSKRLQRYGLLPETPYLTPEYVQTATFIDALMHVEYVGELPAWKLNTRSLTIKTAHYAHMDQERQIGDTISIQLPPPTLRTFQDNWEAMMAQYPGIHLGSMPADIFKTIGQGNVGGTGRRTTCDCCWIHLHSGNHLGANAKDKKFAGKPCVPIKVGNIQTCWRCMKIMCPCSWTKHEDLVARNWIGLGVLPKFSYDVTPVLNFDESLFTAVAPEEDMEEEEDED